jgi:hypothetical protein
MDACNDTLAAMFRVFTNSPELLLGRINAQCALEFLWEAAGRRPSFVPWNAPAPAQYDKWDSTKKASHQFPPSVECVKVLDSLAVRIRYGDIYVRPYTLVGAVVMAVESGDDELARQWMKIL